MDEVVDCEEVCITVPWGFVRGKWWGSKNVQPLLALHGWQDNAGSYDNLAPKLCQEFGKELAVLCIDLPGHGFSSHLPLGLGYYLFWEGVALIRRIVEHYQWKKVKLIGHSLGGSISFLYAGAYPKEVDYLMCLDVSCPSVVNPQTVVTKVGDRVNMTIRHDPSKTSSFKYDNVISLMKDAYKGSLTFESIKLLLVRGMKPVENGKYAFTHDARLQASLIETPSMDISLAIANQIVCPYLNVRAVPGHDYEVTDAYDKGLEEIKKSSVRFESVRVQGTHHVHMNNPERVVPIITSFLKAE